MLRRVSWVLMLALPLLAANFAHAQTPPACDNSDGANVITNPIYILAADTQVPMLKALGKLLRAQAAPVTLVYIPSGSCTNLANMYQNKYVVSGKGGGPYYIPADPNFDPVSSPVPSCTIPAAGLQPDLAMSIVFPDQTDCPTAGTRPQTIGVFPGPVQAMVLAVPRMSSQVAITAEEAYLVFGFGANDPTKLVAPWSDPNFLYARPVTKGTMISIGANIGVPAGKWQILPANAIDQSSALATTLISHNADGNADKSIGVLGAEIYDQSTNRAMLKSLAFRAFKQYHAFWPDSTPTSFDKKNVRDGHYTLWSYVQYVASVDGTGVPSKPAVKNLIDMLVGNAVTTSPPFEPLDLEIANGLVPACAMSVQRQAEGGDLSLYSAPEPCGCYYDAKVPSGSTTCTACTDSTTCGSGMCRHGYCEAR